MLVLPTLKVFDEKAYSQSKRIFIVLFLKAILDTISAKDHPIISRAFLPRNAERAKEYPETKTEHETLHSLYW